MKKSRSSSLVLIVLASIWLASPGSAQTKTTTRKGQSGEQLDPGKLDKILKENNIDPDKIDKNERDKFADLNGRQISKETRDRLDRLLSSVYADVKLPAVIIQSQVGDTATGAVFESNGAAAVVADACATAVNATPAVFQQPYTKRKLRDQNCPDGRTVTIWEIVQKK